MDNCDVTEELMERNAQLAAELENEKYLSKTLMKKTMRTTNDIERFQERYRALEKQKIDLERESRERIQDLSQQLLDSMTQSQKLKEDADKSTKQLEIRLLGTQEQLKDITNRQFQLKAKNIELQRLNNKLKECEQRFRALEIQRSELENASKIRIHDLSKELIESKIHSQQLKEEAVKSEKQFETKTKELQDKLDKQTKEAKLIKGQYDNSKKEGLTNEFGRLNKSIQKRVAGYEERLRTGLNAFQETYVACNEEIRRLNNQLVNQQVQAERNINDQFNKIQNIESQIRELENANKELYEEKQSLLLGADRQHDEVVSKARKEREALTKEIDKLKKDLHAKAASLNDHENSLHKLNAVYNAAINNLRNTKEHLERNITYLFHIIQYYKEQVKAIEDDKKDKVAGANLAHNNPNIADFNDQKRPTKLAEAFSELYDNEWTDAFEALNIDDDVGKVKIMLQILKRVDGLCRETTGEHFKAIKDGLTRLEVKFIPTKRTDNTDFTNADQGCASNTNKQENGGDEPTDGKHNLNNVSSGEHSKIAVPKDKPCECHSPETRTDETCRDNKIEDIESKDDIQHTNVTTEDNNSPERSVQVTAVNRCDKCGGIKRLTLDDDEEGDLAPRTDAHQDTNDVGNGTKHDDDECSENKRSGKDYVIESNADTGEAVEVVVKHTTRWVEFEYEKLQNTQKVALLEMRKTVEAGLEKEILLVITDAVFEEMQLDKSNEEVLNYVKQCVSVCYAMCQHTPPVHIGFLDDRTSTLEMDTNVYKPYTKTGKSLDFVVWPPLYLHEGGPMLGKGVAQAK